MKTSILVMAIILSVANIASADIFGTGDNQFTIDFVNISGDASSANGTNISIHLPSSSHYRAFTDPGSDYRMGTYEVTNDQWDKFRAEYGTVTGYPPNAYNNGAHWTGTEIPTNRLSWFEAAQFVNYLNTSTGHQAAYKFTGTQGTGGYNLGVWESGDAGYDASNPFRNSNAYYFLPTEDEWVKAAYWNGTTLQTYATPDDTLPIEDVEANYRYEGGAQPWNIGSGSEELNGTFDMMGNVYEWVESPYNSGDYTDYYHSFRGIRGGSYYYYYSGYDYDYDLRSTGRFGKYANHEVSEVGFRVASVPEPVIPINLDIKPQSCPNPFNVKSKGVLPVAILGTEEFDVSTIISTSVRLAGVEPIRNSLEDVAAPLVDPNECECSTNGPDGFIDLTLKFKTQAVLEALGEVNTGDILTLPLTGVLNDETSIEGADCIVIVGRFKPINKADINKDGLVNAVDIAIVAENWFNSSIVDD